MSTPARYQIFVSSTYEDLREERQQATQAILETGSFPSGMELFPASDETQWELIRRVIEECDYYIVIVGGRYGSLGPDGRSFTEMEYDFAVEQKVPVLGFVKTHIDDLPAKHVEKDPKNRKALDLFRDKVLSRTCRKFRDPLELGMAVMKSLMHEMRVRPRIGWVRANQARTDADRQREAKLQDAFDESLKIIERLEREIRDRSLLTEEISRDQLAQGSDIFYFDIVFRDNNKELVADKVGISWDDIFKMIGPSLYGYIVRKTPETYGRAPTYGFERSIIDLIRAKIIDRCQGREIKLVEGAVDSCIFQFKELGYLKFESKEEEDGSEFRGVTLTEAGERYLTLLKTRRKSKD